MAHRARTLWWHVRRPITVGVRVLVVRDEHVLLVRHSYMAGWSLPGGGVRGRETMAQAAARELREEVGLYATPDEKRLFGLYGSFAEDRAYDAAIASFTAPMSSSGS